MNTQQNEAIKTAVESALKIISDAQKKFDVEDLSVDLFIQDDDMFNRCGITYMDKDDKTLVVSLSKDGDKWADDSFHSVESLTDEEFEALTDEQKASAA